MNDENILNIYEIERYAQDYSFENGKELKFALLNGTGGVFMGNFLDAYLGAIQIPEISKGFITMTYLQRDPLFKDFKFIPMPE